MVEFENGCRDCESPGYPCLGAMCPHRNVAHYYCDECGDETQLYEWGGQELCIDCLEKYLDKVN